MAERLTALTDEFQKLLRHPFPQDFLQFVCYCCNQKIIHLLRHLGPQILDSVQRFDTIIDQLTDDYYLRLQSQASLSLQDIESNLPSLSGTHMAQLAQVQLRYLPKGVPGPYLSPAFQHNASSSLFSDSLHQAQAALELRQAAAVTAVTDIHPPNLIPGMVLPHLCLFQEADVTSAVARVSKLLSKATNQKFLTMWYWETCPTRQELLRLRQAYHSLDTRLAHLSPLQYTGPHKPFDLHYKITIRHQPNAFLKTILPTHEDCMSQHQMSLFLKLLLGLPISLIPLTSAPVDRIRISTDITG
jgi:hypothetical protein